MDSVPVEDSTNHHSAAEEVSHPMEETTTNTVKGRPNRKRRVGRKAAGNPEKKGGKSGTVVLEMQQIDIQAKCKLYNYYICTILF